jgi:hypothetical protein
MNCGRRPLRLFLYSRKLSIMSLAAEAPSRNGGGRLDVIHPGPLWRLLLTLSRWTGSLLLLCEHRALVALLFKSVFKELLFHQGLLLMRFLVSLVESNFELLLLARGGYFFLNEA